MALENCKDCGKEISRGARRCPNCGAYHWNNGRVWLAILAIVFFCTFIRGLFS